MSRRRATTDESAQQEVTVSAHREEPRRPGPNPRTPARQNYTFSQWLVPQIWFDVSSGPGPASVDTVRTSPRRSVGHGRISQEVWAPSG